jgi:hypothetical protein
MKRIYLLLLVVVFSFSGCEKDDICDPATATTPRLVIDFYDVNTTTPTLKTVTNLGIVAPPLTTGISYNGVSRIYVPLKTTADTTTMYFIQNGADADLTNNNIDVLTFNYSRNTIYVSRACGYKTLFNLNASNPIVQTEPATPDGAWIQNIVIVKPNLETENEVHVQIYF